MTEITLSNTFENVAISLFFRKHFSKRRNSYTVKVSVLETRVKAADSFSPSVSAIFRHWYETNGWRRGMGGGIYFPRNRSPRNCFKRNENFAPLKYFHRNLARIFPPIFFFFFFFSHIFPFNFNELCRQCNYTAGGWGRGGRGGGVAQWCFRDKDGIATVLRIQRGFTLLLKSVIMRRIVRVLHRVKRTRTPAEWKYENNLGKLIPGRSM